MTSYDKFFVQHRKVRRKRIAYNSCYLRALSSRATTCSLASTKLCCLLDVPSTLSYMPFEGPGGSQAKSENVPRSIGTVEDMVQSKRLLAQELQQGGERPKRRNSGDLRPRSRRYEELSSHRHHPLDKLLIWLLVAMKSISIC